MFPLIHATAYVSQARRPFTTAELDELMVASSAHNSLVNVTGVLLHEDGRFFQYLEGPESGVEKIYARVLASARHLVTMDVYRGPAAERYFRHWNMACRNARPGTVLKLATARWERGIQSLPLRKDQSVPLRALIDFWDSSERLS